MNNSILGKLGRKLKKETKQNFSLLVEATGEVKGVVHARGRAAVETLDWLYKHSDQFPEKRGDR